MNRKIKMVQNWILAPLIIPLVFLAYAKARKFTEHGGLEQYLEGLEKYMNGEL